MTNHYVDYIWKGAIPYGISPATAPFGGVTFKVVSDPYYKRISIERYNLGVFDKIVYDSSLFDFRHLKPALQMAWEKRTVFEGDEKVICEIRSQDDRLILIEHYSYLDGLCRSCTAFSPLGPLVSIQQIHYKQLGDAFDGVILFDSNHHQILQKSYSLDPDTKEFADLLQESWVIL
jgi:hypothetical protein